MNRTAHMLALLAAAALAGCNNEDHNIVAGGPADDDANRVAANANVELPPAIVGSGKYRCKDNSLISIDWLSDGTKNSARATPDGGAAVDLVQTEAGGAYTAFGTTLMGDPKADSIKYQGQACHK